MSEIGFAETGSEATLEKAEKLVREAAAKGANIVLLQELLRHRIFARDMILNIWILPQHRRRIRR